MYGNRPLNEIVSKLKIPQIKNLSIRIICYESYIVVHLKVWAQKDGF